MSNPDGPRPAGPERPRTVDRSPDDSDVGWGDAPVDDDPDRRFLEDRPPHWGSD